MSSEYYYRRELGARDLLPAVGIGIGAGLVAFYVARLFLQRTPLVPKSLKTNTPTRLATTATPTPPTTSSSGRAERSSG